MAHPWRSDEDGSAPSGSLSPEAMAVLERARALDDRSGLVFPGRQRGRGLSNMTLTKILRERGLADRATVHGFRSGFRDWCAETGAPREVAEAALAHTVGGVEGAYFRSDLFERRRALMESWRAFLADYTRAPAPPSPRHRARLVRYPVGNQALKGIVRVGPRLPDGMPAHRERNMESSPVGLLGEIAFHDLHQMDIIEVSSDEVAGREETSAEVQDRSLLVALVIVCHS